MNVIEFIPKKKIDKLLDFKDFDKINEMKMDKSEILNLPMVMGGKTVFLKEIFNVSFSSQKSNKTSIKIRNSNPNFINIGANWRANNLTIYGSAGSFLGYKMRGGSIHVKGSAQNFVGCEMLDGKIYIEKNVGDFTGSANFGGRIGMRGGLIKIGGNAGNFVGQYLRRGTIIIKGDAGNNICDSMIAGNVVVNGQCGQNMCQGMKRGTVVLNKFPRGVSQNFISCGIQELNFYSILKNAYLEGVKHSNKFKKFVGDRDNKGIGEILVSLSKN